MGQLWLVIPARSASSALREAELHTPVVHHLAEHQRRSRLLVVGEQRHFPGRTDEFSRPAASVQVDGQPMQAGVS